MKQRLLCAFLACLAAPRLVAQPQPCTPPASMTSFCSDACIICDINGFTGINDDQQQGQAPPGFCTSQVHHMQWIGFIAGSTSLTLKIDVFNCQQGDGLELGLYKAIDCQNFQKISNCDTDVPNNTSVTLQTNVPLVIGQYYFLVMDGSADDVCNYTVKVISGTTEVSPLDGSGPLTGDETVCVGTSTKYTVDVPKGAARFEWFLDGTKIAAGIDSTVNVNWVSPGAHQLCVIASNTCDTASPTCMNIFAKYVPPLLITGEICPNECYTYADTVLCQPGQYNFLYKSVDGCDSLVQVKITQLSNVQTNLDLFICDGDTLQVGNSAYTQSGQYQDVLQNENGCDSTINLALKVVLCQIKGGFEGKSAVCKGESTGSFGFSITSGTGPFAYLWERIGANQPSGNGTLASTNQTETIPNLPAGLYFVTVTDNFGNSSILFGEVADPPELNAVLSAKDYNGFGTTCAGRSDGSVSVVPSGGIAPYTYLWNDGSTTQGLQSLPANTYSLTLTDALGCVILRKIDVKSPDSLQATVDFDAPGCDGINTGKVTVISTSGGTLPYTYTLTGQPTSSIGSFADLPPGAYSLTTTDANGCTTTQDSTFIAPIIPDIVLIEDQTVELAESTRLEFTQTTALDSLVWTPAMGLSCANCPSPTAMPYFTTTYHLLAIAPGGCTDEDSVTVNVLDVREVYVPNVFSPNDDGENDRFAVYGGAEVRRVRVFQVWSRWGELIYEQKDLDANDESRGWDGYYKGRVLTPDVYTWFAEVEFVNDAVSSYKGDVSLFR
jgi:gliding motility-associated-like protein